MDSFKILVSRYLLEKGSAGLIAVAIIVAVVITLTVIFSYRYIKKQGVKDAIITAYDNGKMPRADDTD